MRVVTDEHVPRVFVTTLRSNGHEVDHATSVLGEGTNDAELLRSAAECEAVLVTHDKKDFAGPTGASVEHAEIVVYTDANWLRDHPTDAVQTLERATSHYPRAELRNEVVWLDEWRG